MPTAAGAPFEHHQIPSDLSGLRIAIGVAKQQQSLGARPVMLGGPGVDTSAAHVEAVQQLNGGTPHLNGANGVGGVGIQSELARLRFQVDSLKEENRLQAEELRAALGALSPEAAGTGAAEVPLQLRVQAMQAELQDARMRAQQCAGMAAARQSEVEASQRQVSHGPQPATLRVHVHVVAAALGCSSLLAHVVGAPHLGRWRRCRRSCRHCRWRARS